MRRFTPTYSILESAYGQRIDSILGKTKLHHKKAVYVTCGF